MSKVHDPFLGALEPQKISTVKPAMLNEELEDSESSEDEPAAEPRAGGQDHAASRSESDGDR